MSFDKAKLKAPYIKGTNSELSFALDFMIALLPAFVWAVIAYGLRPIAIVLISIVCSLMVDSFISVLLRKRPLSAQSALIGMIIAAFMPATIPYWIVAAAAAIGAIVRRLLGGIVSPICAALIPWFFIGDHMIFHTALFEKLDPMKLTYAGELDTLSVPTVLDAIKAGTLPEPSLLEHFLGQAPDAIGAMSGMLLLLGLCYLLARRVITWHTPVGFVAAATLVWFFTGFDGVNYWFIVYELCAGGVLLGAFFAATEYTSSSVTYMGRIFYGALCGGLLMLFRYLGLYEESTVLAILAASLLIRPIDMITGELVFGCSSKNIGDRLKTLIPDFKKK